MRGLVGIRYDSLRLFSYVWCMIWYMVPMDCGACDSFCRRFWRLGIFDILQKASRSVSDTKNLDYILMYCLDILIVLS
jgi:hypothetical protein